MAIMEKDTWQLLSDVVAALLQERGCPQPKKIALVELVSTPQNTRVGNTAHLGDDNGESSAFSRTGSLSETEKR